jgi:hypothetical protein
MATPVRLIRNEFELQDLVDRLGRDPGLVERDFALVTIAAGLVEAFGGCALLQGRFRAAPRLRSRALLSRP